MPVLFRVGLGMPFRLSRQTELLLAVDAFHPSDNTESVSLGAEWTYARRCSRCAPGYQNLFQQDAEVGPDAGRRACRASCDAYGFQFDYAWAEHGRLEAARTASPSGSSSSRRPRHR